MLRKFDIRVIPDYILYFLSKSLYWLLLFVAVLLPWRMRIRYSELLVFYGEKIKGMILYRPSQIRCKIGLRYYHNKNYLQAIKWLKKGEGFNLRNGYINVLIAQCYKSLGKNDEYIKEMTVAMAKRKKLEKEEGMEGAFSQKDSGFKNGADLSG